MLAAESTTDFQKRLQRFEDARRVREYQRHALPSLRSMVDLDLAVEIGYHQLLGNPLTVKGILGAVQAAPATVMRRLNRLCKLGVVERR